MKKAVIRIWRFQHPIIPAIGAVLALTLGTFYGLRYRAVVRADRYISKGYGALAAAAVDPFRESLATDPEHCHVLVAAYYLAHFAEKLEWACQACLDAGFDLPDFHLGLSASREWTGRDAEAIELLKTAATRFPQVSEIAYRIFFLLKKVDRREEAATWIQKSVAAAPQNNQLAMEALQFLSMLRKWKDALPLAQRLQSAPTESAEVKLIIARALKEGGDPVGAANLVSQAKLLSEKDPQGFKDLQNRYIELFPQDQRGPKGPSHPMQNLPFPIPHPLPTQSQPR